MVECRVPTSYQVLSVECRVSIQGITTVLRESIPHNSTWDTLGKVRYSLKDHDRGSEEQRFRG